MNLSSNHNNIFNEVGCLSTDTIHRYIDGDLSEDEFQQIKSHSQECEICHEALSGAKFFSSKKDYARSLGSIRINYYRKRNRRVRESKRWSVNSTLIFSLLILIIGIFLVLQVQKQIGNRYETPEKNSPSVLGDSLKTEVDSNFQ